MKKCFKLVLILVFLTSFPISHVFAQQSLPKVPITYAGDTNETIIRRAKWIEGAKKEGTLEWWGILTPQDAGKVITDFKKMYPFVAVNYWRGSQTEVAAKFEAELTAGRFSVDIVLGAEPHNYPRWRKMGFFEKITDFIPEIDKIPKQMFSKYGDWALPGNTAQTPQFNTKLVPEADAPRRWEDLLDPKWKGQIAVARLMTPWYTLALGEGGLGMERTEKLLTGLRGQKPMYVDAPSSGHALVISGEVKVLTVGHVYHVLRSQTKEAPIEWSRVSPIPVSGPAYILQKQAPHPNAAKLFLEWLFSPQGLVAYENATYFGAIYPGAGTRLNKEMQGSNLVYRTEEVELKAVEIGLVERFYQLMGITPQ